MPTIVSKPCPACGESKEFEVTEEELQRRMDGALIQVAFPSMPPEDRERFVSGYCGPCWEKLFVTD